MYRRCRLKEAGDCYVVPGEREAKQHRLVSCEAEVKTRKRKKVKTEMKIKRWSVAESLESSRDVLSGEQRNYQKTGEGQVR